MGAPRFDVVIIGCGPTGVVLANLLGALGLTVAVLEREPGVHPIPRATHIDEETLRNLQSTGLLPLLWPHTALFGTIEVVDEGGDVLLEEPIADPASLHGYEGSRFFDQPAFERVLREGLGRYPSVALHLGAEVTAVADEGDRVTVRARMADGSEEAFTASWAVGCDGGRSVTRAAIDLEMESLAPRRQWLIVDTLLRDAADAALLPGRFRYVLRRERLTLFAHGFGPNRRWEFQLGEGEEPPAEAEVRRWIGAFIDPARLEITRVATYWHNSLVASRWRKGRVLVAGDAAHMMPPTAGQGMCSGIRDAVNLAWKLHGVASGRAAPEILDTYERERRRHVREILRGTLFVSGRLQADSAFQRWRRRHELRLIGAIPMLQAALRERNLRLPALHDGFLDEASRERGQPIPQVGVRRGAADERLDDVLGYRFALVARAEALTARDVEWAEARGIAVWRPGVDFVEIDGTLGRWMRARALDFALVRPDRHVFGAGAARELARVRSSFDRWYAAPFHEHGAFPSVADDGVGASTIDAQ